MNERTPCPECGARLNLSKVEPGKRVRCPKCSAVFEVPAPEPLLAEESRPEAEEEGVEAEGPPPPRGSRARAVAVGRRPARSAARKAKTGASPVLLGGIGGSVVIALLAGYLVFSSREASDAPASKASPPAEATPMEKAPAAARAADGEKPAAAPSSAASPTPSAPAPGDSPAAAAKPADPPPAAPARELRSEYLKRADEAESASAHLELARWCQAKGLVEEARRELERALVYDPKNREGNERIGNTFFDAPEALLFSVGHDGELLPYNKRWLTPRELEEAQKVVSSVEARNKDHADRVASDPWYEKAETARKNVKNDPVLKSFKLHATMMKPYVVFVEDDDPVKGEELGKVLASNLCDLHDYFLERFEGMLHGVGEPHAFKFVLFANRKGFDAYNEKHSKKGTRVIKPPGPEVLAFYHNFSKEVISYRDSSKDRGVLRDQTYSTTFHEGVHQLRAHYTLGGADNYESWAWWWNEGIAEYIAPPWDAEAAAARKHKFESVHAGRLLHLRSALTAGRYLSLFDLLGRTDDVNLRGALQDRFKFQANEVEVRMAEAVSLCYAQAWSFLHFLYYYQDGKYRRAFEEYCRTEFAGRGSRVRLQELLGLNNRADWEELEKVWVEYVKALPLR